MTKLTPIGTVPEPYNAPDNLINGQFPQVCQPVTIFSEEDLKRGSILGRIAEGEHKGLYTLAKSGIEPECILAADCKKGKQTGLAYLSGQFNSNSLIFGEGLNAEETLGTLRKLSIFISKSISR